MLYIDKNSLVSSDFVAEFALCINFYSNNRLAAFCVFGFRSNNYSEHKVQKSFDAVNRIDRKTKKKENNQGITKSHKCSKKTTKIDSSIQCGSVLVDFDNKSSDPKQQFQNLKNAKNLYRSNSLEINQPTVWCAFANDVKTSIKNFLKNSDIESKFLKSFSNEKSILSSYWKNPSTSTHSDRSIFHAIRKPHTATIVDFNQTINSNNSYCGTTLDPCGEALPFVGITNQIPKSSSSYTQTKRFLFKYSATLRDSVPTGLTRLRRALSSAITDDWVALSNEFRSSMAGSIWSWTKKETEGREISGIKCVQMVQALRTKAKKENKGVLAPSLIVYDAGACTKEEHDPATAVLYHRPRNTPMDVRTAICGQLAGVNHFCKAAFSSPSGVRTKYGTVALKHYGRFVLMITGSSREWASSRLDTVSRLLDAATGGIPLLWMENHQDRAGFVQKLSSLLDAVVFHALPDVNFEDGIFASSSVSTSLSSGISPSSDLLEEFDSEKTNTVPDEGGSSTLVWRRRRGADGDSTRSMKHLSKEEPDGVSVEDVSKSSEESNMATLHREFKAVPSVPLPKSGGSAFLKAQQLLEVCQQHSGVLAGSTSYRNRVLNTQIEPELGLVLTSLNDNDSEVNEILQKKSPSFDLPKDVALYNFNLSQGTVSDLAKSIPKISLKRGGRKGLHFEAPSKDLSTLRSALQNQSLHSYPSSIPPLINKTSYDQTEAPSDYKRPMDPSLLCAKINRNGDLIADGRPSRSLPGSPRKIRVATMLPDVGSDSPELRYKVLTARRPKPVASSNNTPRRLSAGKLGTMVKGVEAHNNGIPHRGSNLTAPSLKRKDFSYKTEQSHSTGMKDPCSQIDKENIHVLEQRSNSMDINIKNTKNKLNLHFAPEKVNKPRDDYDTEIKISREINGNLSKDKDCLGSNGTSLKSHLIEMNDDDETSKSEESEISVLELGSFLESKENGNRMFAEATRQLDSPKSDASGANEENVMFEGWAESEELGLSNLITNTVENQWTKVTLYTQRSSNMLLFLFIDNKASANQSLIYNLYRLASSALPDIESSLVKILEMSEEREGETFLRKSYSALTALDLASLHTPLVIEAHRDFLRCKDLTEITLRDGDKVLWGHRNCQTETFYQSVGTSRPGLPIPSDVMSRIPHRARRRLERDHGITIL